MARTSMEAAWQELAALWAGAVETPDLTDFWSRHRNLNEVERAQILTWHADRCRASAGQGVAPCDPRETSIFEASQAAQDPWSPLVKSFDASEISRLSLEFPAVEDVITGQEVSAPQIPVDPSITNLTEKKEFSPSTKFVNSESTVVKLGGRYRLDRLLGEGSFGRVWLGYDIELRRPVAVKVPLPKRFQTSADAEQYLIEARTVASLPHHAHLVPVYDVGRTEEGAIYVVSAYIAGETLQAELRRGRPTLHRVVEVLRAMAAALLHAHARGLIHRDVKPANILIESESGSPLLADFGLAIREEDSLSARVAGSPTYMSPEQARPSGQPLDGRSDLFALGTIAYEMLTGNLPFSGRQISGVIRAILHAVPIAPRDHRPDLPAELERICLKLLQKQPSERYAHAGELIVDLEEYARPKPESSTAAAAMAVEALVTPRGLQAFTGDDAGFFSDLLPGQRDRRGLPESISFWKQKLEATANTFRVGLVLGPSGSGKSSLVRAGVLPTLESSVVPIFLEATPQETEAELLLQLRERVESLPAELSLVETFSWLRRNAGKARKTKVVVIIDQFEQWLSANVVQSEAELVQALAHCDGRHVQTLLIVRDDFGVAANRLLRRLDIPLVDRQTFRIVDLFDCDHAEQVLIRLGRGLGRLPSPPQPLSEDQTEFCRQAVRQLSDREQVIPVKLALFSELVKARPWVPATLTALGGAEGVGVAFLEESLGERGGNPRFREFSRPAQRILDALLPPPGSDIKGHQKTDLELAEAARLRVDSQTLRETLQILDTEIRLITRTESGEAKRDGTPKYQLTHDSLVPALRVWLRRKLGETFEGRAEILLAERTALWRQKPQDRHLPTLAEHLRICRWTESSRRTKSEQQMLWRATVVHGRSLGLLVASVLLVMVGGWLFNQRLESRRMEDYVAGQVSQLQTAKPAEWQGLLADLSLPRVRSLVSRKLTETGLRNGTLGMTTSERIARWIVLHDTTQFEALQNALLLGPIDEFLPLCEQLRRSPGQFIQPLWKEFRNQKNAGGQRLRAAMSLAVLQTGEGKSTLGVPRGQTADWSDDDLSFIAHELVGMNPESQPLIRKALAPIHARLLDDLENVFADPAIGEAERVGAANAIVDYAGSDALRLARLLLVANERQQSIIFPALMRLPADAAVEFLASETAKLPPQELEIESRITLGKRRANAAVTLVRMGQCEKALNVFEMSDDPEAITQFMFRCRPRDVTSDQILQLLDLMNTRSASQQRDRIRYGLLLTLGEYELDEIPEDRRQSLLAQLVRWYSSDPDAGVHGATGWLLRRWGQEEVLSQLDSIDVPYAEAREWFRKVFDVQPESNNGLPVQTARKKFSMTFIVIPAGEYVVGSSEDEPERKQDETRHVVRLTRPFAFMDREITLDELIAFEPTFSNLEEVRPSDAGVAITWYDSVRFARWLGRQQGLLEALQAYPDPEVLDPKEFPRDPHPRARGAVINWPLDLGKTGFRLPTEAEWEVATRGGVCTPYFFGGDSSLLPQFAWLSSNSLRKVHPPGELRPSQLGLFDTHGNVFEWTHDTYRLYSAEMQVNPLAPPGRGQRVVRGGSWDLPSEYCRGAARITNDPSDRTMGLGFRLALSLPRSNSQPTGARDDTREK